MAASAHDVADELRRRFRTIGVAKLHKLLYYVQGWHLARTGRPLFTEAIEAWVNGPVVAELWADERYERGRPGSRPLDPEALATIDYVAERYGQLTGTQLIRLTHAEDPWREISESDDPAPSANVEITHDALARWFTQDDHFVWHKAEVERLRQREDVVSFGPLEHAPDIDAAVARAVSGVRVRDRRPE